MLPATAPAEERVELLLARAGALTAAGRFSDGHGAVLDAAAIVSDAPALQTRVARVRAASETLLGRQDEARRQLDTLQKTTDRHIAEIDRLGGAKEQEVLEV